MGPIKSDIELFWANNVDKSVCLVNFSYFSLCFEKFSGQFPKVFHFFSLDSEFFSCSKWKELRRNWTRELWTFLERTTRNGERLFGSGICGGNSDLWEVSGKFILRSFPSHLLLTPSYIKSNLSVHLRQHFNLCEDICIWRFKSHVPIPPCSTVLNKDEVLLLQPLLPSHIYLSYSFLNNQTFL